MGPHVPFVIAGPDDRWLSRHAVRDQIEAIFTKVGVTSRPKLTAKLFAEQFLAELENKQPGTTITNV